MSFRGYAFRLAMVCATGLPSAGSSAAVAQQIPNPEGPIYPLKTVRAYDSRMRVTTRRVYWVAGYTDRYYDSTGLVQRKLRYVIVPFGPVIKRVSYYPNGTKRRVVRFWRRLDTKLTRRWDANGQLVYVWRERVFDRNGYGIRKYRKDGKWEREYVDGYIHLRR